MWSQHKPITCHYKEMEENGTVWAKRSVPGQVTVRLVFLKIFHHETGSAYK